MADEDLGGCVQEGAHDEDAPQRQAGKGSRFVIFGVTRTMFGSFLGLLVSRRLYEYRELETWVAVCSDRSTHDIVDATVLL